MTSRTIRLAAARNAQEIEAINREIEAEQLRDADSAEQELQRAAAANLLTVPDERVLRWPWRSVERVVGPLGLPGSVVIAVAASGGGKSELVRNIVQHQNLSGKRVYLASLEIDAPTLRLQMAALEAGRHPGSVVSLRARPHGADAAKPESWAGDVLTELDRQNVDLLRVSRERSLDIAAIRRIFATAAAVGADLVVIDHLDHVVEREGRTTTGASVDVTTVVHECAQRYGLPVLATSQTNVHGRGGDRFASYKPVRLESVKFGGRKVEVATTVLGIYRPLDPRATVQDRKAVESGAADDATILEQSVVCLNVIKSRHDGDALGKRIKLRWNRGRITDLEPGL